MNTSSNKYKDVDEYIASFPKDIQQILKQIRKTIKEAAPEAEEMISYGMPGYKLNKKPLVYFAAFKNHIGFYATPVGNTAFANELREYKHAKGSIQFPLNKPMPIQLIAKMVQFKAKQNQ